MHFRRPIATALLCSSLLHLLVAVVAWRWLPNTDEARPAVEGLAISVSLTGIPESRELPPEPRTVQRDTAAPQPLELPERNLPPVPEPALDLNPAPVLREEYSIDMATLALRSPMSSPHRQSLQSALNSFADRLPSWTSDPARPLQWEDGGAHYEISVEQLEPAGPMGLDRAVLRIATEEDGKLLQAQVPVKRVAFSHFAQVVNRWDPEVSLAGDTIIGRFHSNSSLTVDAASGPRVTGLATVAGRVKLSGRGRRGGIFTSGLEAGAARIPMPERPVDPAETRRAAGSLQRIGVDARIRFLGDGSYEWSPQAGESPGGLVVPDRYPWPIIGEGGAELSVEGVVSGSFMVYSSRRIAITGSLHYAVDPRHGPSDDFLALVSDGTVEVAGPEITGPGDLQVFAAIYAGRLFRVRRHGHTSGGRLDIYGSVTAGSLTATEPRFTTRLEFDPRLEDLRPAWFPMTNRYVIEDSDLHWTIESIASKGK